MRWLFWKHYIVQTAVGTVVFFSAYYATKDWLPDLIHIGVCNLVIGPC